MRAWTVDADDIRVAEDFDDPLLHRTPDIDDFLSEDRDDKFVVIGTKGFGKTLLLDFTPGDLQRCATDTDGHLVPRLRAVNTPVAIFIDGVDEYFNKHIESLGSRASAAGQLSPEIWYYSQLGLVEVAYQLRRVN